MSKKLAKNEDQRYLSKVQKTLQIISAFGKATSFELH